VTLFHAGHSQRDISRELGMNRKTIQRWLRRDQFPERKPPHLQPPKVNEFAEYLQKRWNDGCHNASRLYREIREKGYEGKRGMVAFGRGLGEEGQSWKAESSRSSPKHAAITMVQAKWKLAQCLVLPNSRL
jgi:transposase